MIYLKFGKQACIPTLLFGAEIWSLTSAQLGKLKRCHMWFMKKFYQIIYISRETLTIISGCYNYQPEKVVLS